MSNNMLHDEAFWCKFQKLLRANNVTLTEY